MDWNGNVPGNCFALLKVGVSRRKGEIWAPSLKLQRQRGRWGNGRAVATINGKVLRIVVRKGKIATGRAI